MATFVWDLITQYGWQDNNHAKMSRRCKAGDVSSGTVLAFGPRK